MIPLFSTEQIRNADEYAIKKLGMPGIVLMENAAKNIFDIILKKIPEAVEFENIGIICGKGNNGGDGFALARHFLNNGFNVSVISIGKESDLKGDALTNFKITKKIITESSNSNLTFYKNPRDLSTLFDCSLIIDAMLGTGSLGGLKEPYLTITQFVNELDVVKVAVDIPTGLDADKGTGDVIFESDLTVTLAELKSGLFFEKGYAFSGDIEKASIGIGSEYFDKLEVDNYLIEPEDAIAGLPIKEININKYSGGKVITIAGSGKFSGAACLASEAVLKCGGGASLLAFPRSIKSIAQTKLNEVVVEAYEDNGKEFFSLNNVSEIHNKIEWADVISIGSGLGREEETVKAVIEILKKYPDKKFVIDADAIFALQKNNYKKINLEEKILTPHHKEFADLLGITLFELEKDLMSYGKKFAEITSSYLVLKGAPTIIFNPNGEAFINTSGNSGMAKFGTGDVLTGVIASFCAQSHEIENALISAVYLHSLSADLLFEQKTEYGITASGIMENMSDAIKFIINSFV